MNGNLVAFGCSLTFGHGLPDCHVPPDEPGQIASTMAWPSRLAEIGNRKCINKSRPGASSLQIALTVLSHDFVPGDICFVLWSYPDRGLIVNDDHSFTPVGHWIDRRKLRAWNLVNPDLHRTTMCWLHAVAVDSWLRLRGVDYYFLTIGLEYWTGPRPEWSRDVQFLDANINRLRSSHPLALDNRHPGVEAHEAMASEVAREIGWLPSIRTTS